MSDLNDLLQALPRCWWENCGAMAEWVVEPFHDHTLFSCEAHLAGVRDCVAFGTPNVQRAPWFETAQRIVVNKAASVKRRRNEKELRKSLGDMHRRAQQAESGSKWLSASLDKSRRVVEEQGRLLDKRRDMIANAERIIRRQEDEISGLKEEIMRVRRGGR